jgi:membrane protein
VRVQDLGLTLAIATFILVAFALVLVGPKVADHVATSTGLGPILAWTWKILQWPLVLALLALGAGFVYYFAPYARAGMGLGDAGRCPRLGHLARGLARFKYYVTNFATYSETYGALGGVTVMLLWFYLFGWCSCWGPS